MNNNHDPLDALHGDDLPVQPDPAFAARLRVTTGIGRESLRTNQIEPKE